MSTSNKKNAPRKGPPKKKGPPPQKAAKPGAKKGGPPRASAPKPSPKDRRPSATGAPREPREPVERKPKIQRIAPTGGPTRCGTVAILGRPNVGKSTLLNAILGQKIAATTHKPQTTRRNLRGVETRGDSQIVFVDTPGLHTARGALHGFMIDEALDAARGVDLICFVVEASTRKPGPDGGVSIHPDDEKALQQLQKAGALKVPMLLVVNKVDVVSDKKLLLPLLQAWSGKKVGEGGFETLIPIAARTSDGVDVLLEEVAKRMPPGPFLFDPEAMTDARERDIAAELIREKVMLELQQELPYRAAVIVEDMDESRREDATRPLVRIAAVIHVERDSQKAMVIGKGGQRIKAIGERSRKELEKLLGCQVMLELLVRVEADWTSDPRGLAKLGYVRRD